MRHFGKLLLTIEVVGNSDGIPVDALVVLIGRLACASYIG
ncbi:MAG: hypothetical protein ACJAZW_001633 [Maritalea sp.]